MIARKLIITIIILILLGGLATALYRLTGGLPAPAAALMALFS